MKLFISIFTLLLISSFSAMGGECSRLRNEIYDTFTQRVQLASECNEEISRYSVPSLALLRSLPSCRQWEYLVQRELDARERFANRCHGHDDWLARHITLWLLLGHHNDYYADDILIADLFYGTPLYMRYYRYHKYDDHHHRHHRNRWYDRDHHYHHKPKPPRDHHKPPAPGHHKPKPPSDHHKPPAPGHHKPKPPKQHKPNPHKQHKPKPHKQRDPGLEERIRQKHKMHNQW